MQRMQLARHPKVSLRNWELTVRTVGKSGGNDPGVESVVLGISSPRSVEVVEMPRSVNSGNQTPVRFVEVEVTVEETPEEYTWMFHARCRGINPAEFFPSDGTGVETAQRVC